MPIDRFTKEEFEEVLLNYRDNWLCKFVGKEWRYRTVYGEKAFVYVNSSIGEEQVAQDTGDNSIRVWVEYDGKPLKKSQHWTTRVPGWQDRLIDQIRKAFKIIDDIEYNPPCPKCGGAMQLRAGVHGKFYGCLKFPDCRGTRQYEELSDALEWIK